TFQNQFHIPVMTNEVLHYLLPTKTTNKTMIIDATVGGGGHTKAILENLPSGIVVGIDWDQDAINYVQSHLNQYSNLYLFQANYTELEKIIKEFPDYTVQGILFDLGVSAYQLTTAHRGFSYNLEGPLDMRFNQSMPMKIAREIIQYSSVNELKRIFSEYGEEKYAKKIATAIVNYRNHIKTTAQLVEVIRKVVPNYQLNKILARIFQALRIAVNNELMNIKIGLQTAIAILATGARLVVISYHSLEDRVAKQIFRSYAQQGTVKILTKKPIRPQKTEVVNNPSARSARLRAIEKIYQ
ncbi:MAG: 16S rRNA (cytosine(1402)-N(4))-methyltransferase RsmH, partial [candidate division WOR-3 bacterium]|nr:16S rRNA (cytosine(1402)-N(4))-methyltransferase RsmH [candidate division WOR-3 bacterium]